ncbi:BTAD domain-containing putative transcriptional regulator [Nonomuraea sp. NPDC059194]|uniref:AfsR/SARP family transcriptional regulator n=1 Tax=Nonomuraea sp. NPDC059194 TaxID=3346764 RepID=UPI00368874E9
MVSFHVLGPLEVWAGGRPLRISGRKPRMLLATLLLDSNHLVSADLLVEVLWDRPPRSAQANLRTYTSALRSSLGARIRAEGSGYLIEVAPQDLDLLRFERLVAGRDPDSLAAALALWRGAPLADLPDHPMWARRLAPLHEVRLAAARELIAALLEQGAYGEAVALLRPLCAEHPFREDLWGQLMLALHWSGRQAEALACYTAIRRQLVAELGVEPGAGLRQVQARVLEGEPPPGAATGTVRVAEVVAPVPRQLPPDVPDFVGRVSESVALAAPVPLAVISGPPGSGKSALAVHAAHALTDRFPAGQLFLSMATTDPAELLAQALRALGATSVPDGAAERSALYRSILADRPMLVVLDDAMDASQVRPLLPGHGSSVIVTSRSKLTSLPGALQVHLEPLSRPEAEDLLRRIVGQARTAREPEAATAIVRACGYVPLAVRIAGARLAARPGWSLALFQNRLMDENRRIGELRIGDLDVRTGLDHSYRGLPMEAARALHTLGRLGGAAIPGWVVDAVLDRHLADDVSDALVDADLLRLVGTDRLGQPRFQLPDLVRCHALEQRPDPAALARVVAGWTATAELAIAKLPPTVFTLSSAAAQRWWQPPGALDMLTADPLAWFEVEHGALEDAVGLAASAGLAEQAWGLAAAMVPYLDLRCHFDTWQRTHRTALAAARVAGDRYGEAAMLRGLAQVCLYQDRYAESEEMFARARQAFRELGDMRAEATSVCGLGAVAQFRGRHPTALSHFRRALAMFDSMSDLPGAAYTRQAIGRVWLKSGDQAQAAHWLGQALRLAQELGDVHREGCVSVQLGGHHVERALEIFESLGDLHCGAYALQRLAGLQAARGELVHASTGLERALAVFRRLGDRSGQASSAELLGELYRSAGRVELASGYLSEAVALRGSLAAEGV